MLYTARQMMLRTGAGRGLRITGGPGPGSRAGEKSALIENELCNFFWADAQPTKRSAAPRGTKSGLLLLSFGPRWLAAGPALVCRPERPRCQGWSNMRFVKTLDGKDCLRGNIRKIIGSGQRSTWRCGAPFEGEKIPSPAAAGSAVAENCSTAAGAGPGQARLHMGTVPTGS